MEPTCASSYQIHPLSQVTNRTPPIAINKDYNNSTIYRKFVNNGLGVAIGGGVSQACTIMRKGPCTEMGISPKPAQENSKEGGLPPSDGLGFGVEGLDFRA